MPSAARRRLLSLAFLVTLGFLTSCDPPLAPRPESFLPKAKIRIVTVSTHWADVAREVGGEAVIVECLSDPKPAPPVPKQAEESTEKAKAPPLPPWEPDAFRFKLDAGKKFEMTTASLAIFNGLGLEQWLTEQLKAELKAADVGTLIIGEMLQEAELIRPGGPGTPADPCLWNAPGMVIKAAEIIRERLSAMVNPKATPYFDQKCISYTTRLQETQRWLKQQLKMLPTTAPAALVSHDTLHYFAKELGIETKALFKANGEPTGESMETILAWLAAKGVNVLSHDVSLTMDQRFQITSDYMVVRPKPYYSRWLDRPGTLMPVGATHLDVSTCEGAIRSIAFALDSKRLGGERRLGTAAPPPPPQARSVPAPGA